MSKKYYIDLLRNAGFNCFPIPGNGKVADSRYKARRTEHDQIISDNENYGYIPSERTGTCIIDLDHKEEYRQFAENMIKDGYMVIETGKGWHIPVCGISGNISKMELFDYSIDDQKIVEIQGPDHYCVGPGCAIYHDKLKCDITYENRGSDKIWNGKGQDFHKFVEILCTNLSLVGRKKSSRSSYKNYRERFLKGYVPTKGTSNDYFFQAAIQCNTDGFSQEEATAKIQAIYDKWVESDHYSERPWENVLRKITEVYDEDIRLSEGRPKGSKNEIDTTGIALEMINQRKLYSDVDNHIIFENSNGFLEKINNTLKRELQTKYPRMEQREYTSILFKLEGLAAELPATNKDLTVFANGVYDKKTRSIIKTDDIADMGFRNYNYVVDAYPTKFIKILFENTPASEHPRIKVGLRSILINYLDPRISIIIGEPGTGKSTVLLILVEILGDYAMAVELEQLLEDRFIRAKMIGKRLLVLQDIPDEWKNFSQIKTMTGEQKKTERGFMSDSVMFENKLKIWGSGNYLPKIPENEKNAMYTRRLSLIHNVRIVPYPENATLFDEIVKEEGELIISWILNLPDEQCKYEDPSTLRKEWEELASPEVKYLNNNWDFDDDPSYKLSVKGVVNDFKEKTGKILSVKQMSKALDEQGWIVKFNVIQNIKEKIQITKVPNPVSTYNQ